MNAIDRLTDMDRLRDRAYRVAPQLRAEAVDQFFASGVSLLHAVWARSRLAGIRLQRRTPEHSTPAAI